MKITSLMHTAFAAALLLLALPAAPAASAASPAATSDVQATPPSDSQSTPTDSAPPRSEDETYSADEIVQKAAGFFGATTEAVAKAVERVFSRYGRPNAYIAGGEGSGAFFVGLRYGEGDLYMKSNGETPWQMSSSPFFCSALLPPKLPGFLNFYLPFPKPELYFYPRSEGRRCLLPPGTGLKQPFVPRGPRAGAKPGRGWLAGVNGGYLSYAKGGTRSPFLNGSRPRLSAHPPRILATCRNVPDPLVTDHRQFGILGNAMRSSWVGGHATGRSHQASCGATPT